MSHSSCSNGFGLVSLFHGTSTLMVYLMPKSSLYKNNRVKVVTTDEGNPKAPFSITSTQMDREGNTPFSGLLHFTLDTYLIMQEGIKYHSFESLVWLDRGLNSSLLGPLVNTLPTKPMGKINSGTIKFITGIGDKGVQYVSQGY